jgi:hypothetical protein
LYPPLNELVVYLWICLAGGSHGFEENQPTLNIGTDRHPSLLCTCSF